MSPGRVQVGLLPRQPTTYLTPMIPRCPTLFTSIVATTTQHLSKPAPPVVASFTVALATNCLNFNFQCHHSVSPVPRLLLQPVVPDLCESHSRSQPSQPSLITRILSPFRVQSTQLLCFESRCSLSVSRRILSYSQSRKITINCATVE